MKESKTWAEAQSHCREMFADLAAIHDQNDNNRLWNVMQGLDSDYAWIGLYDSIIRWKWVLEDADFNNDTDFSNWRSNEPNNNDLNEYCVLMTQLGSWRNSVCWEKRPAVCFNGKKDFY